MSVNGNSTMNAQHRCRNLLLALTLLALVSPETPAQGVSDLSDLRGWWAFHIGDNMAWADPVMNDRKWDSVLVPARWEDQGYPGYDGYAWYRKHFTVKPEWKGKILYLNMGVIDDVDEVYVNGHFIGFSGLFPPQYLSDYAAQRQYPLPRRVLNEKGENVIAVRVYDSELSGGITGGRVGIAEQLDPLRPDVPLVGEWRIMTGDDFDWKESAFDDTHWRPIEVPAFWETQGMKGYDGFAWYRLHFRPEQVPAGKQLVLLLGKVDDFDETFLNGEPIGRTGTPAQMRRRTGMSVEYKELRAYELPEGALRIGADNVLAVRVLDTFLHGGIYDGPIGLITRDRYVEWNKRQGTQKQSLWQVILDWLK
jgi:sialate O-acetylesterase